MTDADWEILDYFKRDEAWGDPAKMDLHFVRELDALRGFIKTPIIISCGTQGDHTAGSRHFLGLAADCLIPGARLLDAFLTACRFSFTGIGFYPSWEYHGRAVGGLHLERDPTASHKKFWVGVGNRKSNTLYVGLTEENLRTYYKGLSLGDHENAV